MTFPPHQRVCVVGHLLDLHVGLKLGFPFDRGHVEIHGYGTNTQEFVQITTMSGFSWCILVVIHSVLETPDFHIQFRMTLEKVVLYDLSDSVRYVHNCLVVHMFPDLALCSNVTTVV